MKRVDQSAGVYRGQVKDWKVRGQQKLEGRLVSRIPWRATDDLTEGWVTVSLVKGTLTRVLMDYQYYYYDCYKTPSSVRVGCYHKIIQIFKIHS